ncbi:unnamed protein product [Cylicocyclus nassatus]|uniref:Mitochondrial assembly of ribosomal large subunit protein 1 n=1 Tax=Cylicocyclus nassatus TaxID=53992 RepID=A0AA36H5N6_CYLNA|nr:unnamed protein product [Cylicocyclus nassatus]
MDSMRSMSLKLSRLTPNIARLLNRGYVTSQSMPILSRYSVSAQLALGIPHLVSRPYSVAESDKLEKSKFKQSQDYFSQYIEEYYEDDQENEQRPIPEKTRDEPFVDSLDGLVTVLRQERAQNIVVLALGHDGPGVVDTVVICSPFNAKHGAAIADMLRKAGKMTELQTRKCSVRRNFGWFQIELGNMQVHVLDEESRQRYNLECLWGLDEFVLDEIDDFPLYPPSQVV